MKHIKILLLILIIAGLLLASCQPAAPQTGILQGGVTIGPITPVERPGFNPPVPPEVFSSRKILVYDESGKNLVKEVSIQQIGQTANGFYTVQLPAGAYTVDIPHTAVGGARNLPQKVTITAGGTTTLDINIDTGIR